MIKHVVFFKFSPDASQEARDSALEGLAKLPNVIDTIREFELGRDVLRLPRSWDAVLIATYESKEDLKVYSDHPAHVAAAGAIKALCESIGSVDFEY